MKKPSKCLHHYNQDDHNENSASIIVPHLLRYIGPRSVVDVGCGLGQWLAVFKKEGVGEVLGLDGAHVPKDSRKIDEFLEVDLADKDFLSGLSTRMKSRYDLCLSLEVAEHLPESLADEFVSFLISLSDYIMFSAAIPNQTGENHLNEQPHKYWVQKFAEHDYECHDIFRKIFWNDERVNWWYRQNMFFFVKKGRPLLTRDAPRYDDNLYIHPKMLDMWLKSMPPDPLSSHQECLLKRIRKKLMFWGKQG